ncbi:MAG: phosphate ABC transporter permease subunit PstC [Pseudanabaenaceae cyanobacterium]
MTEGIIPVRKDHSPLNRIFEDFIIYPLLALLAAIPLFITILLFGIFIYESFLFFENITAVEIEPFDGRTFGNSQGLWAGIVKAFTDTEWTVAQVDKPGEPGFAAGLIVLLVSTLTVSGIAIGVAIPLGILSSIYLAEYAPPWLRTILKPALESLSGIPTVILGYFGLFTVTPLLQKILPEIATQNGLAAGLVLGLFLIPTVSSLAEESLRAVPEELRQSSYALGLNKVEMILRVILPAAFPGIAAASALAVSRAFGETMIPDLAGGRGGTRLAFDPLNATTTMTSFIVTAPEGDIDPGSFRRSAAFMVGMLLFLMTLALNTVGNWLIRRNQGWLSSALVAKADVIATKAKASEEQLAQIHHQPALATHKYRFQENYSNRRLLDCLFHGLTLLATLVGSVFVFVIFYQNLTNGWESLNWGFLTRTTNAQTSRPEEVGILVSLVCSLIITSLTAVIVIPLGIGAGIFLEEYLADNWWRRVIDVQLANLAAVPTIIYGLLGFGLFVRLQQIILQDNKVGKNILSAVLTLVLIVLPLQLIATRTALKNVPNSLRYAGYATGMSRWQVIWHVVLPASLPMIASGSMLAIATAIAETAALIAVGAAAFVPMPEGLDSSFITLPLQIYFWNTAGENFQPLNSAAIIVLVAILLVINLVAVLLRNLFNRKLR